jgi:preprotein translocase subunit SecA
MFADEVTAVIEDAVCNKKLNLKKTKRLIFQNLQNEESPHIADIKLVENCFIQVLIDCARIEFEKLFDESCSKKDFVDHFMSYSDEISTINHLLRLSGSETYMKQLEEHSCFMDEYDLANLIVHLKAYAWKKILEQSESRHAELDILHCLITCFQTNTISQPVHEKLEQFKKNCESQPRSGYYLKKLMSMIEIEKSSARQLRKFLQSIKTLESDHLFLESQLLQLIRFYLKPVEISIKKRGNRSVVEIIGGIIYMSEEISEINKLLNNMQQNLIDELRFIAVHTLKIDCDLENSHWHGFNIFIIAANVNVSKNCTWNLSGLSSQKCYKKATSGNSDAKDGDDGIDGCSGESSGNVMIVADQIQNPEWLTVILNGGNGTSGQDGGDGANGKNGEGISMNELKKQFPSPSHFWGRLHHLHAVYTKICTMGEPYLKWSKGINCYAKLKLANGQEIIHSASRYITSNCYLLYKGSEGQAGGLSGMNGLGGEGGYQGECIAVSKENKPFSINIKAIKGCDGQNGKPGRTGEYGKNGWDVGYVDFQTWTAPMEVGADQKQRLRMDYSTDSSNRVYCAYQYDVLGSSMCYATIKSSTLQHRKLTENEKSRETSTKRQRQQQAVATHKTAMQRSAMEQIYGQYFENGDHLLNGILQMNTEVTMNLDLMRQKAKTALQEVEKLKERSREKVSRYQVYDAEKKVRKIVVETTIETDTSSKQQKNQILSNIKKNLLASDNWIALLEEEFSEDELNSIEKTFDTYRTNRKIETPEIRRIQQKFGLAKFHNVIRDDYLPLNIDNINQCCDCHNGKYLKISEESNFYLHQILEYQDINDQNEKIQNAFDDLLTYRVCTDDFNMVKTYYEELSSIKIGSDSLREFLEHLNIVDEEDYDKTIEKISLLKFNTIEWKKLLKILHMFKIEAEASKQLKCLIPIYNKEIPNKNEDLIKHLFDFNNQLCSVKNANTTLSNLIELFIIDHEEDQNVHSGIQTCLLLYKTFLDKKQNSIEKIHQTVQFLSHRPRKSPWQKSHEFPNFSIMKRIEKVQDQQLNIHEELLQKLYHLYLIKQNETMDWHKQIDDNILAICLNKIKSNKSDIYPPLFELIAWKQQLNIKIYIENDSKQFVCIQDHFNLGKKVEHLLFREGQTIKCLISDEEFIKLNITRENLLSNFQFERSDKKYFPFDDIKYSNDDIIIYELCQFFDENDRDKLENHLKKLSTQFIGKNSILSSLLYCFMCNGCHFNLNEILILVNTILECLVNFDQNSELFSYIILAHRQFELIDELILIKLENLLRKTLRNKGALRHYLKNIKSHSVKILLATKLGEPELIINEELFSAILTSLPYIKDETFLEQLILSEWLLALKNSYWQHGLTKGRSNFTHDGLEQCSFYLVKLENSYGRELVENLVNVLNDTTVLSTKTLLTFVHRFYAEDTELCSDILNDFGMLNENLSNLFDLNSNEKYTGEEVLHLCEAKMISTDKQLSFIKYLMTKLGLLASEDRNTEALIEIIQKAPQHNKMNTHLLKIEDILRKTEYNENLVLKYAIDSYNRQYACEDSDDYRPEKLTYDTCCNDETSFQKIVQIIRSETKMIKNTENCDFYILDIVNRGIKLKRGFSLRATQKLAVLLALMNENNLLTQAATGEGKTLIIATFCIIKCLYGEKLDIVTSCSVLAKRDAESEPPKGNIDLYGLFGVRIGHICSEDIDQRIHVFNNCDVIYGDLSSFQRDYLLDRFYGKNILGRRIFESVIVDEVDSMLLDNGNNMLYLSHDIPNMDKLQSLYVYLWQSVNRPINSMEDLKRLYDNSAIKQSIIADLYGMVMQDEVEDDVWKELIESKTSDQDGRLLKNLKDYSQLVKQFQFLKQKTENRLIFLLNNIASRNRSIKIPEDLYEFVERHLDKFIDNAKHALFMSEGVDYVIDVDRTGLDPDLNPKIIIIDKNTGTDQSSSQWHEGLHQFLQIKHGCKLSLMSLKAVFISNVSYLKLYKNLYGLSGTLGSRQEKDLLNELYGVDLIKIPTSKPKHFFEEQAIIAGYKEQWIDYIYIEAKKKLIQRRSVLIICETVKDVDYITKHLIKQATEQGDRDLDNQLYKNLKNPYIYKREHEEFIFGEGNAFLSCEKVIVATNLAGRGTDIKLESELIKAGGLHVILTFLPANCRVEEQAYGRAARCGEEGSGQLIVIGSEEDGGSYSSKIFQLKNTRDAYELQRLKTVKKFYDERITIEEDCFKQFKEHYDNLRQQIETCSNIKNITKLLLDSFLDKWAFWLDAHSHLIETQATDSSTKELLFDKLKKFLQPISLQFDHWLDSPSQYLKLGNYNIKNKEYGKARKYFQKIITNHPYYLAEALYYSSAIIIKEKNNVLLDKTGRDFQELKKNLVIARELFEQRINDYTNDQAIVQAFKKKETNSLIHIEGFSEQQKTISQIYNLFINSINDILGHPVSYNAFVNYELNEILAYDIFNELQRQSILTQPKNTQVILNDSLTDLSIEYGISKTVLKDLRKELQENTTITAQSICQVLSLPNIEEFWTMLLEHNILVNQIEFVMINKQKLELIQSSSIQTLVQKNTIKMELNKLPSTDIFQYPIPIEEDHIVCSIIFYKDIERRDILYLESRGVCSINRKGSINANEIKNEHNFLKFDSITISNLINANIANDEGIMILEKLSDKHVDVLQERNNGKYKLKGDIDCSSLPLCYREVVASILNSTFAYRLAYVHLQEYFREVQQNVNPELNLKFQFRLISNPYQRLIFDLIDKSIIEDIHVDYKKMKSANFEKIFCDFTSSYAKHLDHVKKKENLEYIDKVLNQLSCGIERLETPDCFFSTLEGTLKAQQNSSIVEASWFALNGIEDLIVLQEQAYSWKFWRNAAIVTCMALAQITLGAVIEIFTAGIGTYAASFCMSEGIDRFFINIFLYY